jgi:hypothetical protein
LDPAEQVTVTFTADVSATLSEGTYFTNTTFVYGAGLPISASVAARTVTTFSIFFPLMYHNYPPLPVLDPIPAPQGGVYTVTWQCNGCEAAVSFFVLQRATDYGFTQNVQEFVTTEMFYPLTALDVFYFRVRADGDWGQGAWSNIRSTGYYDGFSNSASGWPNGTGVMYVDSSGVARLWRREYRNNDYRLKIDQGGPYAWFWHPAAWAPYVPETDKYCIETKVKFEEGNIWANMGVIMGSSDNDSDKMELYAFCLARNNEDGLGWFLMYKDNYKFPSDNAKERGGCSQPTGNKIEGFAKEGGGVRDGTSREGWNRVRLGVNGNKVKVYIGDHYKGEAGNNSSESAVLSGLKDMEYVGVIGGDYELTPIDIRYDYFKVIQGSDCNY